MQNDILIKGYTEYNLLGYPEEILLITFDKMIAEFDTYICKNVDHYLCSYNFTYFGF